MAKSEISVKDVKSLCSYNTRNGREVWVGECPAGYFYGNKDGMQFSNRLLLAFRFMPTVNHSKPDEPLAHLQRLSGDVPASLVTVVTRSLPTANGFASSGSRKDSSLPFSL